VRSEQRKSMLGLSPQLQLKVAFVFPLASRPRGDYWWATLEALTDFLPNVTVILGAAGDFCDSYIPDTCRRKVDIHILQGARFIRLPLKSKSEGHYAFGIHLPPVARFLWRLFTLKPDIIFVSGFSLWTFIIILLKAVMKWKVVLMYEGSSPSVDRIQYRLMLMWRQVIASKLDTAITNTRQGKQYLCKYLSILSEKVFVHPYEVPNIQGYPDSVESHVKWGDSVIFATVGRLIYPKGVVQLLEAAHLLSKQRLDKSFQLWIIGDGPLRNELESKVNRLGLQQRVRFFGWINNRELGSYLKRVHVFVFPTLEDVWGIAPLEAMAMGKPVIISKYAGAHELIKEGVNGFIVDPLDVESLADLMLRFIEQPQLIQDMGQKARATMKQFTPNSAAEFLAKVAMETYERN